LKRFEELGTQLKVSFDSRKVKRFITEKSTFTLPRPAEDIATDVAEVSPGRARNGGPVELGITLSGQNGRSDEGERIEKISGGYIAGGRIGRGSRRPAWPYQRIVSRRSIHRTIPRRHRLCQSVNRTSP